MAIIRGVTSGSGVGSPDRNRITFEVLAAFALATTVAAVLYRVPALDSWFHVIVAALFLYLPAWLLRHHDLERYGLHARPLGRNLLLFAVCVLVVFPPFALGFVAWERLACAIGWLHRLAPAACGLVTHAGLRLPPAMLSLDPRHNLILAELVVVALPEEFFFRGYVQGRLTEAWAPRWRLLGAPVGGALVVSSALFALTHVAVQGNPATLAVFFPGLVFGWMRARSGSILPGVLFHASCNLYIETLHRSLFG